MSGYSLAYNSLTNTVSNVWPRRHPWINTGLAFGALGAMIMDAASEKYANKPSPPSLANQRIMEMYEQELAKLHLQSPAVTVNVVNQPVAATATVTPPVSRYLREEGNTDANTDCFGCAGAHLAALKGGLERARGIVETKGVCDQDCKDWLAYGVRESGMLLAGDWYDEKVNRLPAHQKAVIERYRQRVRDLNTGMLGGSKQAQALNEGHGYLDESVRFVNAGDPLDHPQVFGRFRDAVPSLTAAERVDIYHYDTPTANELRAVRQGVDHGIESPDDLKEYWGRTRVLAEKVNDKAFSSLDPAKIGPMAEQADRMYKEFAVDRVKYGMGGA